MNFVNDDNFMLYAARHYDNPSCATEADFLDDVNRIKFILKMFKKYDRDGIINERLVLNHLILLYNVFERDALTRMLMLKLKPYASMLKPFLVLLSFWPNRIQHVGEEDSIIYGSEIQTDTNLQDRLRIIINA